MTAEESTATPVDAPEPQDFKLELAQKVSKHRATIATGGTTSYPPFCPNTLGTVFLMRTPPPPPPPPRAAAPVTRCT